MFELYAALECAPGATEGDLRSAFRRIALDSHPDRHPNDAQAAARFRLAAEAWATLGDAAKREAYDLGEQVASAMRVAVATAPAPRVRREAAATSTSSDFGEPRRVNLRPGGPLRGFATGGYSVVYCDRQNRTQLSETFQTVGEAHNEARRLRRMGLRTLRLVRG